MSININVVDQKMLVTSGINDIASGTKNFVKFKFELEADWTGLSIFAQFRQGTHTYNRYLDTNKCCCLPSEIGAGTCTMMLYGTSGSGTSAVIGTTNYLTFKVVDNGFVADASSTEVSTSLYEQLIAQINAVSNVNAQGLTDLENTDANLQAQINTKANATTLQAEIVRAQAAEATKASASDVSSLTSRVSTLESQVDSLSNNQAVADAIEEAVQEEMAAYLLSGELAQMTITDGSIARAKVNTAFEATLAKADSAMQPSMYDPRGLHQDVYAYAAAKADLVKDSLEELEDEVDDAYTIADGETFTSLGAAIRGAVTHGETYTRAALADYSPFSTVIVNTLPNTGAARTFYLVPKDSGSGYDKYWYITDTNGNGVWDVFGGSSTEVVTSLPATGEADVDYILSGSNGYLYYKWINGVWRMVGGAAVVVASSLPVGSTYTAVSSPSNTFIGYYYELSGSTYTLTSDTSVVASKTYYWKVVAGDPNTDYYIMNSNGNYTHFRYINNQYHVIGGDAYTKQEVNSLLSTVNTSLATNAASITSTNTNLSSLSQTVSSLQSTVQNIDTDGHTYTATYGTATIGGTETSNVFTLYDTYDGTETAVSQFVIAGGGGGGGSTTSTTLTVERITDSPLVITTTDSANISISFSSVDEDEETYDATYVWKLGNTTIMTGSLVQGTNTFDLSDYVSVGTQKFTLTVTDETGNSVVKSWTVQKVDVRIETNFSDRYTNPTGSAVTFTYTPYGAVSKTIHFKLDGVETTVTTAASGTLHSYSIPAQTHGAHMFEVWATATVNNQSISTNHIYKDIIWYDSALTAGEYQDPVIGCAYRFDRRGNIAARQYDTTAIVYNVYDPSTSYPTVKLYEVIDGVDTLVSTNTVTQAQNTWNYSTSTVGLHTLKIKCGDTSVTVKVNVTTLGIDVTPITTGLALDFNPNGITNASSNRVWSNANYSMSVSNNFDWANGGYKIDENGDTYFLVKAGTTASFNYYMFSGNENANTSTTGAEMKIVFMTENVRDKDAVWFTNVETTTVNNTSIKKGIQMGVHEGWFKTNNASDSDTESGVASTNTYLYMPYSEEDVIEMDINFNTLDREDDTAKAFIMAYEDGVPSKAYVYDASDVLYQVTPQPITIGSANCDVRIYRMKIYSNALTTQNIMKNFIADSRSATTMLARYDRNSIYYNADTGKYTPYSGEGVLSPERLATVVPNCKILMLDTDHFTTSKKTFVKSTLRCIHAPGGDLYPGDSYYDNWFFQNGYHSGQGTTSDNYGNAGRNVDFLFNCDGTHKPSDKVNAEANYISSVTLGYGTENAHTESVTDWMGSAGKVTLTRTSVPNNFFNFKVNIASSENVNNALMQKRYNDFLPYISPAKARDSKIKNDMEFVPAILFIRENNADISTHNEFKDTDWHFYAIGNLGDSKKTDYTRAYDPTDMNEFTLEISDNTKNNATFQTGVYMVGDTRTVEAIGDTAVHTYVYPITSSEWSATNQRYNMLYNEAFDGDHSFEERYACCGDYRDGKKVNDTHSGGDNAQIAKNEAVWRAFYRWVITSTDQQFTNELDQWCVRSAVEFFYAFTHMYTMMDNRAKNTFWHFAKTGTYRAVSRPVAELLHVYCEKTTVDGVDTYTATADTSINANKTYYTQYAFDLWDYDNDTSLGINNNGELIFPYGKEDTDYNIENDASSGYVFNGATSVFWCRLRDLLASEIKTVFNTTVATDCFSATHLINQFDSYQECYPEEIWRLDIERKYIRTFNGTSVDNSKEKSDVQYLRDMMQGRKRYQRRQWVRDQEIYFGTKNLMNTVVGDNNRITFRCFTPTGNDVVVDPNYTLSITPYSDMYVSVMFGNGSVQQVRAKGGTAYTVTSPLATMDDTQVTIYGANRIQALNDLSACYIAANNFSMATKLRKLVLGNVTTGYNNSRLTSLTLGNNVMLEELDLRNCGSLGGSLNLSQCNNLRKLFASGTGITGVIFATNGKVENVSLPNTINTLTMRNLDSLASANFSASLSGLINLTLEGGLLDNKSIVTNAINNLTVLKLYNINWTGASALANTTLLNQIKELFSSELTGDVYISGAVRQRELDGYDEAWPDLDVTYDANNMVTQYTVTYVNADSPATTLYTAYVDRGATPPNPVTSGYISTPTLASTEQYSYVFSGWDNIPASLTENKTITATYTATTRNYTVNWYSRAGLLLYSTTADYGAEAVYNGAWPTNTSDEAQLTYHVFKGWNKSTGFIRGNTDVYAIWDTAELPTVGTELYDMSPAEIYGVATTRSALSYFQQKDYMDITLGHDFDYDTGTTTAGWTPGCVNSTTLVSTPEYFGGSTSRDINQTLFAANQTFTIAIDYQFIGTTAYNTLFACYDEDGYEGIRLYYNGGPCIRWGDKMINVGSGTRRDMLVIRHRAGSNTINIYNSNGTNNAISVNSSQRSQATTTNSIISLGAIRFIDDGAHDYYGNGWINWAKVWFDDLGDTAARQLAAWPHEELRMEYYYSTTENKDPHRIVGSSARAGMSFYANQLLENTHVMNTTDTNAGGWNSCNMRTFCNGKLYDAMPTVWKSMIKKVKVTASNGSQSTSTTDSEDYIYIPSYKAVSNDSNATYSAEGCYVPWFTSNQKRAKFLGIKTRDGANYFVTSGEPSTVDGNNVQIGDVWQPNGSTSYANYVCVSKQWAQQHNRTIYANTTSGDKSWTIARNWWLRSPYLSYSTGFWIVDANGGCYNGYYGASYSGGVCAGFSI